MKHLRSNNRLPAVYWHPGASPGDPGIRHFLPRDPSNPGQPQPANSYDGTPGGVGGTGEVLPVRKSSKKNNILRKANGETPLDQPLIRVVGEKPIGVDGPERRARFASPGELAPLPAWAK